MSNTFFLQVIAMYIKFHRLRLILALLHRVLQAQATLDTLVDYLYYLLPFYSPYPATVIALVTADGVIPSGVESAA